MGWFYMTLPDVKNFKDARKNMAKAYAEIAAGEFNVEHFPCTAVEKAYYSLFHACHSALALLGVYPHSHEGVHNLISKKYIKDGLLPKEIPPLLSNLEQRRIKATYDHYTYTSEDARCHLDQAISAVKQIHEHLLELYPDVFNPETLDQPYKNTEERKQTR